MPFDFPNPPLTVGQTVVAANGVTYKWDGTSWLPQAPAGGGASITVSDTAPASPTAGALWFDSLQLNTFLYYNDGNSSQWVTTTPDGAGLPDAPSDGFAYSRANGQWASGGMVSGAIQLPGNAASALQAVPLQQLQAATASIPNNVGRNYIHNAAFNVLQRGTAAVNSSNAMGPDRWMLSMGPSDVAALTPAALADTDRTGIGDESAVYGASMNVTTAGVASNNSVGLTQRIESVRRLSGKMVTLSFWAAASGSLKIGVGYHQFFGGGGTPSANVAANIAVLAVTGTWTRYSYTFTVPSASGKTFGTTAGSDYTMLTFWLSAPAANTAVYAESGNLGTQTGSWYFWGVQLELGSAATSFEHRDWQQDLAICQRFYQANLLDYSTYSAAGAGCSLSFNLPVQMRATPTMTTSGMTASNCSGQSISAWGPGMFDVSIVITATGAGRWYGNYQASADL